METQVQIAGLVAPDLLDSHYAEVARGAARVLRPQGYTTLISDTGREAETERDVVHLLLACPQVKGLILASVQPPSQTGLFRKLDKRRLPYVLLDRTFPGLKANFVGTDDEAIGAAAAAHLIARGCRHIAHIQGPETSTGLGRCKGYLRALKRHNLKPPPLYLARGGADEATGWQAMRELLTVTPRLDGVVCFNDAVAVGAIKAILEAGLEVPYDIEVIGAGNQHYSDILRVPLSTVDLNSRVAGERAAELLLKLMAAAEPRPPERILVPFELMARESSKAVCF